MTVFLPYLICLLIRKYFIGEPIIYFCSYADTAAESGDSMLEITELEDEPLVSRLGGGAANISLLITGPSRIVLEVSTLPGSEATILQWSQGDIGPAPPRGSHGRPYLTTQLVSGQSVIADSFASATIYFRKLFV